MGEENLLIASFKILHKINNKTTGVTLINVKYINSRYNIKVQRKSYVEPKIKSESRFNTSSKRKVIAFIINFVQTTLKGTMVLKLLMPGTGDKIMQNTIDTDYSINSIKVRARRSKYLEKRIKRFLSLCDDIHVE